MLKILVVAAGVSMLMTGTADAQETRAELLAQMREQKAKSLQPYTPKGAEKVLLYVEEKRIIERLTVADGFYPRIGGLTSGSGFAMGVGYRKHLLDEALFANVSGVLSTKAYKAFDAQLRLPLLWRDRIELWNVFDPAAIGHGAAERDVQLHEEVRANRHVEALGHVRDLEPWRDAANACDVGLHD